ncbi:hypothetical protein O181_028979 [Austropuccinia psidii MF-1]|uniref:Uncharacterized protein n=1 Tax=Austropuccinia psidii MF-1 TaxID=1389203 RepID=A0A9Q3H450_9BASI|nr:hypothetical protein [Austropuccinia psidii MF-1]
MQFTEEPFACQATPASVIIINNMPVRSRPPLPLSPTPPPSLPSPEFPPIAPKNTTACSPQCQAPLDSTMRVGRNLQTCD